MGSSEITFDDNGAGVCLVDLMESELAALRPECSWEIESHIVYQMPNMADRCLSLAERVEPDLIALWLGGNPFSEETVSFAVYHRSRRLYPYVNLMVNAGRGPAEGGIDGSGAIRGALYRALRGAGRAVIGRRALIDPVVALASTVRTLEALQPRWPVLCRLPYRDPAPAGPGGVVAIAGGVVERGRQGGVRQTLDPLRLALGRGGGERHGVQDGLGQTARRLRIAAAERGDRRAAYCRGAGAGQGARHGRAGRGYAGPARTGGLCREVSALATATSGAPRFALPGGLGVTVASGDQGFGVRR